MNTENTWAGQSHFDWIAPVIIMKIACSGGLEVRDLQSYFVAEAFEVADRPACDGGAVALFEVAVAQIGEGLSGLDDLVQYDCDGVGYGHGGPVLAPMRRASRWYCAPR